MCKNSIASVIVSWCQVLGSPLELDPTLGQLLEILFLRLLSISIPAVLSDRNNYGSEFLTLGWQPHPSFDALSFYWR